MKCDTLYRNGTIYTMSDAMPTVSWVATQKGRIIAHGNSEPNEVDAKRTIDLVNKVLFPGFIDSHLHGTATGIYLSEFNLSTATSIKEILNIVQQQCMNSSEEWVCGSGLDIQQLKEKRAPYKEELDDISENHPVYIKNKTMHGCLLNSKALELLNIPNYYAGIVKDGDGNITGEISSDDAAIYVAQKVNEAYSDERIMEYIHATVNHCLEQGCTTIACLDGGTFEQTDRDFHMWLYHKDKLPIHIVPFYQTEDIHKVKALNLPRIGGCLCLDGATFEGTMASRKPYNDKEFPCGILQWEDERLYQFLKKANEAGLQTAMHAIGDAAIDQYLRIYEMVYHELSLEGNPNHNRIEHFSLIWPEQIEKAVSMGLILSMQPIFTYLWDKKEGNVYAELMDQERAKRMEPYAEILRAGGLIAGGSDSPVTLPNPMAGIHSAVNLDDEEKRVTVYEAIKMFTRNGAIANWQENEKGSIEVGKLADFVVLDQDPFENPQQINQIQVLMTIVEDKIVYQRRLA